MSANKILIVEDDTPIAELLAYRLKKEGYDVGIAGTGARALQMANGAHPDLVLLDWQLPDMSGLEVCRQITNKLHIPIIMVTARNMVEDKVLGLEAGADDYITKPFDLREVVGRVRAILRRFDKTGRDAPAPEALLRSGRLTISEREWAVLLDGERVSLTPKEFELLVFFVRHPRQVFSRDQLLSHVWGYDFEGDSRTVDIHVQRLRKKLDLGGQLLTVFGVGYKYAPRA